MECELNITLDIECKTVPAVVHFDYEPKDTSVGYMDDSITVEELFIEDKDCSVLIEFIRDELEEIIWSYEADNGVD